MRGLGSCLGIGLLAAAALGGSLGPAWAPIDRLHPLKGRSRHHAKKRPFKGSKAAKKASRAKRGRK